MVRVKRQNITNEGDGEDKKWASTQDHQIYDANFIGKNITPLIEEGIASFVK